MKCPNCGEPIHKVKDNLTLLFIVASVVFIWMLFQASFFEIKVLSIAVIIGFVTLIVILQRSKRKKED